jgi:hypothetical protein
MPDPRATTPTIKCDVRTIDSSVGPSTFSEGPRLCYCGTRSSVHVPLLLDTALIKRVTPLTCAVCRCVLAARMGVLPSFSAVYYNSHRMVSSLPLPHNLRPQT